MCLSKAIEVDENNARKILYENIKSIDFSGDLIVLTDLFGNINTVNLKVKNIDFIDNYIILKAK